MPYGHTFLTSILIVFLPIISFGQIQKPEQMLKNYLLQLKGLSVDTLLIVKSGCAGCEVKYSDTSKGVTDGQTIYVLSKQMGQFKIVSFDDFGRQNTYALDTCSLFDTIIHYKAALQQKDMYYKKRRGEWRKGRFFPPRPIHYSYNDLTITFSKFSYEYQLVEPYSNNFVFPEANEPWFTATKMVIDKFFSLLESVRS